MGDAAAKAAKRTKRNSFIVNIDSNALVFWEELKCRWESARTNSLDIESRELSSQDICSCLIRLEGFRFRDAMLPRYSRLHAESLWLSLSGHSTHLVVSHPPYYLLYRVRGRFRRVSALQLAGRSWGRTTAPLPRGSRHNHWALVYNAGATQQGPAARATFY